MAVLTQRLLSWFASLFLMKVSHRRVRPKTIPTPQIIPTIMNVIGARDATDTAFVLRLAY